MAKDYEINLKVDTGSSVSDLNNLESALSGISDELVPLTTQMGEMEDKLMLMAYAGDTTSDEFKRLSHEVAGMRRSIRETDAGLEALSMTTSQKVGGALSGVTSGFELAQGVMGSFGVESEAVEKALLRVQSAMAIAQGVQGFKEALPAIKALGSGAVNVFKSMTTASKLFMLSGIGLVITGITTAMSMLGFFSDDSEEFEKQQEAAFEAEQARNKDRLDSLNLRGSMEQNSYQRTIDLMKAEGKDVEHIEKLKINASINFQKEKIKELRLQIASNKALLDEAEMLGNLGGGWEEYNRRLGANNEMVDELNATKEGLLDSENQLRIINAQASQERIQSSKDAAEAAKEWKDEQKSVLEEITKANTDYLNSKKSEEEQEIISAKEKWKELIDDAKKYKLDTKALVENQNDELSAINKKYRDAEVQAEKDKQDAINLLIKESKNQQLQDQEDFDALYYEATTSAQQLELDAVGEKYFYLIETAKQYGYDTKKLEDDRIAKEKEITDKYAKEKEDADKAEKEKEKERIQTLNEYRVQAVTDTLSTIGNLTTLFAGKSEKAQKRAFNIQKAVNIAQAIMDTYKAANVALASAPPPYNFIAMAAAITTGLVNVKSIMAQKFEGSGSAGGGTGGTVSSGGGGGTSTTMTPQFNVVGNSGLNQLAQVAGQPVQAYVVSGQITTAQSLDRNKIENATL